MPLPPVFRWNYFTKIKQAPYVDNVSKFLIIVQLAFGLNRIAVLGIPKIPYLASAIIYTTLLKGSIIAAGYVLFPFREDFAGYLKLLQYMFSCVFGFLTWSRVRNYYGELEKFDMEVGCRPYSKGYSIKVISHIIFAVTMSIITTVGWECPQCVPIDVIHIIENYYYAHLIALLTQRLEMLNYFLEASLINKYTASQDNTYRLVHLNGAEVKNINISKLMAAYYIIIDAYDLLTAAMKWQLLVIIAMTFISTLIWVYGVALVFLRDNVSLSQSILDVITVVVTELFPLAAPCVACDGIRAEVGRLRELLSSKLHESKLDKSNRSVTRALLALTETRNLSFSLFRMIDISISLPFSFLGLLATYLIILLQFEKVIFQNG